MPYDAIGSGAPGAYPATSQTVMEYLDTNTGAEWVATGQGWQPNSGSVGTVNTLGVTAAVTPLLVFSVPKSGLYSVSVYAAQATATNGTLPQFTVAYTEGDTGTVIASTNLVGTPLATTSVGSGQASSLVINAKAGTTISVSSAAPTTLTANVKARIAFNG